MLAIVAMMACEGFPALGWEDSFAANEDIVYDPHGDPIRWMDPFDDLEHVYIPTGGLVGVEVAGGDVRLLPGCSNGWIASEVIVCPFGFRYDLVVLDVNATGGSFVQLSILNPALEPTQVGYANETVPGFDKLAVSEKSVYAISPATYPSIRIQVSLVANGTHMPRLLGLNLYFTALDEWLDEFVGSVKRTDVHGLNITGGVASIDLTGKKSTGGGSGGDYEPYPPLAACLYKSGGPDTIAMLMPKDTHDGYKTASSLSCTGTYGIAFDDLDMDGDLDMALANYYFPTGDPKSAIYWNDGSNAWSSSDSQVLDILNGISAGTGDFNGDGFPDIVIGTSDFSSEPSSGVFLNDGQGGFGSPPDVLLPYEAITVTVGDLNYDGYDDIVLSEYSTDPARAFFGGPDGPDNVADLSFSAMEVKYDTATGDLNGDGRLDLVMVAQDTAFVYYGSEDGVDATADEEYSAGTGYYFSEGKCGDIDADGFDDLVVFTSTGMGGSLLMYPGGPDGLPSAPTHTVAVSKYIYCVQMVDVDKDGFCDIAAGAYGSLDIFFGGDSFPTSADFSTTIASSPNDIAFAVPRNGGGDKLSYRGSFVTELIPIPDGNRWDVMHIDGTVPPNTTVEVSVLDAQGRPISGYEDIASLDIDLSGLAGTPIIKLKVKLATELNTTTPSLDRMVVKWLPRNAWRDEFYGPSKTAQAKALWPIDGSLALDPFTNPVVIVFANMRGDAGYGVRSRATSVAEMGHPEEFSMRAPVEFDATGASAVSAADVNGDGFTDIAFASHGTSDTGHASSSPVYMGSPAGWRPSPMHEFQTTGASDVLLRDINGDGLVDVVFAQESDDVSYDVPSLLFLGRSSGGWNATPDVEFSTVGASGVVAADLDGDGRLDLAFSCYRDSSSTATESMAFLQTANGFCGTAPDLRLPTMGARAVDAGDVNGDGRMDLAFANSFSGGLCEIDSYVYLGKAAGGFESQPVALRTAGAEDVKLADIDGDGDVDAAFANSKGNTGTRRVDSYVYLNRGAGSFPAAPDLRLPTTGASAVAVADLYPGGYRDLLFACEGNGTGYEVMSRAFIGCEGGIDTSGLLQLPTKGASDVTVLDLTAYESLTGGYVSKAITPDDPRETGGFDTLRYAASIDDSDILTLSLRVVDATTWETLAEFRMADGKHELSLRGAFMFKEHPSVRLMVVMHSNASGEMPIVEHELGIDQLWLNWTKRTHQPPSVLGLEPTSGTVLRLVPIAIDLKVVDEYDPVKDLRVQVEHRSSGAPGWESTLVSMPYLDDGTWRLSFTPKATSPTGAYDFRARVTDADGQQSPWVEFPAAMTVRNNVPTAPEVRMDPGRPVTTSTLSVAIVRPASDIENSVLTYRYAWFRDGTPMPDITSDTVNSALTTKGQNWSVEVRAWDGEDAGPVATAWRVIQNAAPIVKKQLPMPEVDEDTTDDRWLDLSSAFEDPDGDPLAWSLGTLLQHLQVSIDPATGRVTIVPEADWNGRENVTFVASDGELQSSQVVGIIVRPVNDVPSYISVDGRPIQGQPIVYTIKQGQLLLIKVVALDVEGDELQFSVNSTIVEVDGETGEVRFQPDNDEVGTLRFCLRVWDSASPNVKVPLNFTVSIENVNDPMDDPRITNPRPGDSYKANTSFTLIGVCTDPDMPYGQVLNYTWTSNISGPLGYGSSLQVRLLQPGTHHIMLSVTDGEFEKTTSVDVVIEPKDPDVIPPGPDDGDDPSGPGEGTSSTWLVLAVVIVVVGAVSGAAVLVSKRRSDAEEAVDAEATQPMDKQEALKRMADAVRSSADELETDLKVNGNGRSKDATTPTTAVATVETVGGIEVVRADMPTTQLSIEAKVTEAASADVQELWEGIDGDGTAAAAATAVDDRDKEKLRLENLKRKYHNAIGRLPYGIPAAELRERDWNELAAALAMGQKKALPDGRETTSIGGRWYYSDPEDSSTFLKEHGPKAAPNGPGTRPASHADRAELLAKLEERFIIGEISEEAYRELRRKYGG